MGVDEVIRQSSIHEIESHLLQLGGKNHEDNVQSIRPFRYFYGALALAIAILQKRASYVPQPAYLATAKNFLRLEV